MDIGEEQETIIVEPYEDPIPHRREREAPATPTPTPVKEPTKVPAGV